MATSDESCGLGPTFLGLTPTTLSAVGTVARHLPAYFGDQRMQAHQYDGHPCPSRGVRRTTDKDVRRTGKLDFRRKPCPSRPRVGVM